MRFSEEAQRLFEAAEERPDADWTDVATDIQKRVLREAGAEETAEMLQLLRTAGHRYPGLFARSVYNRENRAARGCLQAGMPAPDFMLAPAAGGAPVPLLSLGAGRTLVLVAGSYS